MRDIWKDYDRALREQRVKIESWEAESDRQLKFILFGFGFCMGITMGFLI